MILTENCTIRLKIVDTNVRTSEDIRSKMPKSDQSRPKSRSKWAEIRPTANQKRSTKSAPKAHQKCTKSAPKAAKAHWKCSKSAPKSTPKRAKNELNLPRMYDLWPKLTRSALENAPKMVLKRLLYKKEDFIECMMKNYLRTENVR